MANHPLRLAEEPGLWPPTWPMGLTFSRLLLLPLFLFVLIVDFNVQSDLRRWLAAGIFALMAITDLLDGYIARRLGQTSYLGMILDPIADKILVTCSIIALSFQSVAPAAYRLPIYVVAVVLLKDVTVVAGILALRRIVGKISTAPKYLGKAATFVQLSMVVATLIGPDLDRLIDGLGWWVARLLWAATTLVTAAALADYVLIGVGHLRSVPTPGTPGEG